MKDRILKLDSEIYKSESQYFGTFTSKMVTQLSNHYVVKGSIYTWIDFENNNIKFQNVVKIPYTRGRMFSKYLAFIFILKNNIVQIRRDDYDIIYIGFSSSIIDFFTFIYPLLFPKKLFYIQLSTPSVNKNVLKRFLLDFMTSITLKFFDNIGGRSTILSKRYNIPKSRLLPVEVGMPDYGFLCRQFNDSINLLYVGSLNGRDIWKTVIGLAFFLDEHKDIKVHYDIVGGGSEEVIKQLSDIILSKGLENIITYHGFLSDQEVVSVFKDANVGVSFVPITSYYEGVPITKTIEYFLAGMPVIATLNKFNKDIIDEDMGVLCVDSPEGFAQGLKDYSIKRNTFDSTSIRNRYAKFSMAEVMKEKYFPYIDKLIEEKRCIP